MKLNGVAIEAVEVARMKAAASLSKTSSFSTPRRRISHEERQAQIRTLIELEELMNLEALSSGMPQQRSSRSIRKGSSSRMPSQDWESRSVSSAPNLASYRPRVIDISSRSGGDDVESVAGFSFHSEGRASRNSRKSSYDDDDMSSVGLRSVNSDSRKNSKHRRSIAKALFGRRKKKSSSSRSQSTEDDDRSTATSKSRKLFLFTRRNSTENTDATSVVSDGSLHTRRRRGLFGRRSSGTEAGEDKSIHSYNSSSSSVASMMRRMKKGHGGSSRNQSKEDDDERSLDSVSAISSNTQSSDKSSKKNVNKFNIFKFLSRQKKAKKTIQNFEELPTFLIPDRVAIPEPEPPEALPEKKQVEKKHGDRKQSERKSEKKQAEKIQEPVTVAAAAAAVPIADNQKLYVRGSEGALEVDSRPPLPDKKKKTKQQREMPVKESREIIFDCHEETKTVDGDDDDGSVFTILSGIIAAWASETAAKKAREPKKSRSKSMSFGENYHRKSCLKSSNPIKPRYSVSFGVISIREYERTVGDNPSVTSGPPISIGWSYMPSFEAAVDEYETSRPCRRTKREFYLPSDLRKELLLNEWGYTVEEVRRAKREATYIQYHREKSAYQGLLSEKAQELAESTRRKVNRLRNGNNTKKEQAQLWDQAQERLGVLTKPPPTTVLVSATGDMDDEM